MTTSTSTETPRHPLLAHFSSFPFEGGGAGEVWCIEKDGPGVIIVHELPGMTPECLRLGKTIADAGFSVYLPLLFGEPGHRLGNFRMLCILREWNSLAKREATPMTDWVRALGREVKRRRGGKGIGAIGMCATGGFVIPLLLDGELLAPVTAQPSLPMGIRRESQRALGLSAAVLADAAREVESRDLTILGFRYEDDWRCPKAKFDTLRRVFGPRFEGHEYAGRKHSVLAGAPVAQAIERTVSFLRQTLL